jgi:hypothetical protein
MKPCQTSSKEITQETERKINKGQRPKSTQVNNPKEASHMEVREPLQASPPQNCKQFLYVEIE